MPGTLAILRAQFENSEHVSNICVLLDTFQNLVPFWLMKLIEKPHEYSNLIDTYENNMRTMYDIGAKTVLTKNIEGDTETLYFHVA